MQIAAIKTQLSRLFFDTSSSSAPFSALAIFRALNFSGMIESHLDPAKIRSGQQGPSPAQLLRAADNVPDRKRKEQQQAILTEIMQTFKLSGAERGYLFCSSGVRVSV